MLATFLEHYFHDSELRAIHDVVDTDQAHEIEVWIRESVANYQGLTIENIIFIESSIVVIFGYCIKQ